MKAFLLTITLASVSLCALPQAYFLFDNIGGGANAPVADWDGTNKLFGPTFAADLYYGPLGTSDPTLLTPLRQPTAFASEGYFLGGTKVIPGYGIGSLLTVQVRVWDMPDGDSYEAVLSSASPTARVGQSNLFPLYLGSATFPSSSLTGLIPFKTVPVQLDPPAQPLPPPLTVTMTAANYLLFAWPSYWQGWTFALQQSPSLTVTNWLTLTNTPTLTGSQSQVLYQIDIPAPSGHMFYRLLFQ